MEVILLERVENLGQMGDTVTVKNGYARNFLLPRKKALRATEENRKFFENQRAQLEAANLKKKEEALNVAQKLKDFEVIVIRQAGEMGQLYGSVVAKDIALACIEKGVEVDRKQVALLDPIKTTGIFDIKLVLHPEVIIFIKANIARSEDEAEIARKAVIAEAKAAETAKEEVVVEPVAKEEEAAEAEA